MLYLRVKQQREMARDRIQNPWEDANSTVWENTTTQKMRFFIKDFLSKCDQKCRKLRIWSHLLKKSLMENFIVCAVRFLMIWRI